MNRKFSEVAEKWLENDLYDKKFTYQREMKSAVNHLNRFFAEKNCNDIKGIDVDNFIRYCYENKNPNNHKPFSKRLLKDIIGTGYYIFEFALENELIDNMRNPFTNKKRKIPKDAPKYERSPITDTQKQLILTVSHRMQSSALIMLYCGLRKGELISLEWSDINFNNKVISVTKSAVRNGTNSYEVTPHTKNGKDRYVPIPDNIINYLKLVKYEAKDNYIFPQKNGNIQTITSWNKAWDSYQKHLNYQL